MANIDKMSLNVTSRGLVIQVDHPDLGSSKGTAFELVDNMIVSLGSFLIPLFFPEKKSTDNYYKTNESSTHLMLWKDFNRQMSDAQLFKSNKDCWQNPEIKFKVITQNLITKDVKLCFLHSYSKLIPEEILSWSSEGITGHSDHDKLLADASQLFLFFTAEDSLEEKMNISLLNEYNNHKNNFIYPGMPIVVESTPFASISFLNSWSHGIVSKVLEHGSGGIVTDARLTYGCEGAPIYMYENGVKGKLIGVVVQTLSWCHGEWVGFSLGLSIKHLLQDVLRLTPSQDYIPFNKLPIELPNTEVHFDKVFAAVVFVRSLHRWGSGVVIDADNGIILTCSHIVHHAQNSVWVKYSGVNYPATVEYCTPEFSPLDLAVLSVKNIPRVKQLDFADNPPVLGERVYTAGYPLSTETRVNLNSSPTLSAGIVSKVSSRAGPLQTTCCTQSGVSGGALVSPPNQLLGIVVCNVNCDNTTLPEFSFSVSAHDIKHTIHEYLSTRDPSRLRKLCLENTAAKMEWALMDSKL